ncbi:MAG: response regulator [Nitrospinaceae bacterium]|jgi:two-component system, OmpR family, phosphate regulon response regulator PhoB|nr:response regulator [Nitrospina sp.]MBT5376068.1 response regulator [Nitrospinaceae bacterium]
MKKILIVDDEPRVRELLTITLNGIADFELCEAHDGEQAVKISCEMIPDLILMDVKMPGSIDGLAATKIIKNNPKTQHCCIILLTAYGQEADKEKGFEAGADDYIVKPFSPVSLIERIEKEFKIG